MFPGDQIAASPLVVNDIFRFTSCLCNPPFVAPLNPQDWDIELSYTTSLDQKTEYFLMTGENKTAHALKIPDFFTVNSTIQFDLLD